MWDTVAAVAHTAGVAAMAPVDEQEEPAVIGFNSGAWCQADRRFMPSHGPEEPCQNAFGMLAETEAPEASLRTALATPPQSIPLSVLRTVTATGRKVSSRRVFASGQRLVPTAREIAVTLTVVGSVSVRGALNHSAARSCEESPDRRGVTPTVDVHHDPRTPFDIDTPWSYRRHTVDVRSTPYSQPRARRTG